MLNFDEPFFNVVAEVKKVHEDVLGPGTNLVVQLGHFNTCRVVFKGTADSLRFREGNWEVASTEFQRWFWRWMTSLRAVDRAINSAFIVLSATSDCILEPHTMGQLVQVIRYPVQESAPLLSLGLGLSQFPAQSAST